MTETESPPESPTAPPAAPAGSLDSGKGFPEGTPLTEMTDAQKAAYWQHYARKHEDTVKAFGLTPQQVKDLQSKVETLESEKLSSDEKALKAVRDEAFKQARSEAEAEFLPQLRAAKVQSIASQIVSGDKLSAFMDIVDPSKLLGEDGSVDETKVMGYLTAMYGGEPQQAGPRWQNFGQYTPPPPPQKTGAGGTAEAERRFGKKT